MVPRNLTLGKHVVHRVQNFIILEKLIVILGKELEKVMFKTRLDIKFCNPEPRFISFDTSNPLFYFSI